jgi:hypothetical protein
MASGHVNRIKRPNTWLHRPMLQNVKKALANPEPSTHGPKLDICSHQRYFILNAILLTDVRLDRYSIGAVTSVRQPGT